MGKIICKKHGYACIVEPCQHVANEIDDKKYGKFYHIFTLLLCKNCLQKYNLENFSDKLLSYDGDIWNNDELLDYFFDAYDKIEERTVRCTECVAVAKVEQARINGEQAPFPTYNKTLNSHSNIINKFMSQLKIKFQFQKSIVVDNHFAVFVKPGAYTYPMTVTIYYIVNEEEQTHIIKFIDEYFQSILLNQVKIEFFEAEVWNTWSNC
jgi:hypothetical protein